MHLSPIESSETETEQAGIGLGWSGVVIHGILLLGGVLTLMNLERTFRASVGTMRWRVKLVILGLGILFAVRIYTSSQALLYRSVRPFTEGMDECALIIACLFIGVSILRTRVFGIEVYPSHVLLQRSLTVLLSGLYLLIVGILSKVLSFLGGGASFSVKGSFCFGFARDVNPRPGFRSLSKPGATLRQSASPAFPL